MTNPRPKCPTCKNKKNQPRAAKRLSYRVGTRSRTEASDYFICPDCKGVICGDCGIMLKHPSHRKGKREGGEGSCCGGALCKAVKENVEK